MFYTPKFHQYISQYQNGIKKISFKTSSPKVDKNKLEVSVAKRHGNYQLNFNKKGQLTTSSHFESNRNYEILYTYNAKGKLWLAIQFEIGTNILMETTEFLYDTNQKISSQFVRMYYNGSNYKPYETTTLYTYNGNIRIEIISTNLPEDSSMIGTTWYSREGDVIEEKFFLNETELMGWTKYEYDTNRNLLKEISLNENGEIEGTYEFFPSTNGMRSGYNSKFVDKPYKREYVHEVNAFGHWIQEIALNDGVPIWTYNREIEYY